MRSEFNLRRLTMVTGNIDLVLALTVGHYSDWQCSAAVPTTIAYIHAHVHVATCDKT